MPPSKNGGLNGNVGWKRPGKVGMKAPASVLGAGKNGNGGVGRPLKLTGGSGGTNGRSLNAGGLFRRAEGGGGNKCDGSCGLPGLFDGSMLPRGRRDAKTLGSMLIFLSSPPSCREKEKKVNGWG